MGLSAARLPGRPAEEIRPPRLFSGDDLLEMGYKPGRFFSEILRKVEDAQLVGTS